jgi:hypothetical protein
MTLLTILHRTELERDFECVAASTPRRANWAKQISERGNN